MKSLIVTLSVIAGFLVFTNGYSQDKSEVPVISTAEITSSPIPDPAISEIVRNINNARIMEDAVAQVYWETKLNELTQPQIIYASDPKDPFIGLGLK